MKKRIAKIALVLSFALIPGIALAVPGIPHQFYGSVNYSDGPASDGLVIEAKIDDAVVASSYTADGKYGYNPNLFFVTDPDNNKTGKTIKFFVDGVDTGESEVFENGGYTEKNLTLDEMISPSPAPTPPPATSGSSGSGGGSGGSTVVQTASPSTQNQLSAAAQAMDINNDDRIDILDFNTLMVNWNSAEVGNVADFNNDNKVDIFDFNLLMIHWTG